MDKIEYTLDLTNEHDYMINYKIVSFLYEIRDKFLFEDKIEYTDIITNYKILHLIDEINFTYVKGLDLNNIKFKVESKAIENNPESHGTNFYLYIPKAA